MPEPIPPLLIAPPPPGWTPDRPAAMGPTGMATASLVLGIVALVLNVLLIPTVLAVVFGAVALAKGTAGRTRSIVGIVLGALGVVALGVQAAIAIPVLIGVQQAAVVRSMEASITNGLAQQGTAVTGVDCPAPGVVRAGATTVCTATGASGTALRVDVTFTDTAGGFTYRVGAA
ncbi:hypothetical protein GCM10009869_12710 [Amnibacterium kyonggiense]